MNTTGMKNVEAAFTKGGGAGTNTPAHASLKDDPDRNKPEGSKNNGIAGIGTESHEANFGDQHPQPGLLGKLWYKSMTGSETGTTGRNSTQS